MYSIYIEEEYLDWFNAQPVKSRIQIRKRLSKIEEYGYFGYIRNLSEDGDGLHELKFNDGRRIYYVIVPASKVVLILGGNKNGQDRDIWRARGLIQCAKQRAED